MLFCIQSEQSVIGCLLNQNDSIDKIPLLQEIHFYNSDNREIFKEIIRQIKIGRTADLITVGTELKKIPDIMQYINTIINCTNGSYQIENYANKIVNFGIKRALVAISNDVGQLVSETNESSVCVDLVASRIEELTRTIIGKEPKKLQDTLTDYYKMIEMRLDGQIKPIKTGFSYLDKKLGGGLERGTLTVIAGRPAMGKSAFGVCVGMNVSRDMSALFISMEMSETQLNDRIVSILGEIPINFLRQPSDKNEFNNYWERMTIATKKAIELNLHVDDQSSLSIMQIRNKARKVKRRHGLDCLIIDQLSFIVGAESEKSWDKTGEYTRQLIQVAKELDIAVILLCQLNRECEKRQNKRPMLSDLASSGSIEQDASTILFLYRDIVYNESSKENGIAEVIIGKQRQGSVGTCYLEFIDERTEFKDSNYLPADEIKVRPLQARSWANSPDNQ